MTNTTHLNPVPAEEGEENQQYPSFTKFNILNYIYSATLLISIGLTIGLIVRYVNLDLDFDIVPILLMIFLVFEIIMDTIICVLDGL